MSKMVRKNPKESEMKVEVLEAALEFMIWLYLWAIPCGVKLDSSNSEKGINVQQDMGIEHNSHLIDLYRFFFLVMQALKGAMLSRSISTLNILPCPQPYCNRTEELQLESTTLMDC